MALFGEQTRGGETESPKPFLTIKEADALIDEKEEDEEQPPIVAGPEPLVIVSEAERVLVQDDEKALGELEEIVGKF